MWYGIGVSVVMIVGAYALLIIGENSPMGQAIHAIEDELSQE